jgi:hypothetical protein
MFEREEMDQGDRVANFKNKQAAMFGGTGEEMEERLHVPEIGKLAHRTRDEVAGILAMVLKSKREVTGIVWQAGDPYITIKYIKS